MIISRIKQCMILTILFSISILQTVRSCDTLDADVSLEVQGMGLHRLGVVRYRDLIYQIRFNQLVEDCYVAIYLHLPFALYVNINELTHLRRLGDSTACSIGETDVELFTEKAQTQNVTICSALNHTECVVKLPIHQRYQYANENNTYINITLPKPKLLLGCKRRIKEYRVSKIDMCSPCAEIVPKWREIPYIMDTENILTTPVGEATMLFVVTYATLLLTILCTMFLIQTIWKSIPKQHPKKE